MILIRSINTAVRRESNYSAVLKCHKLLTLRNQQNAETALPTLSARSGRTYGRRVRYTSPITTSAGIHGSLASVAPASDAPDPPDPQSVPHKGKQANPRSLVYSFSRDFELSGGRLPPWLAAVGDNRNMSDPVTRELARPLLGRRPRGRHGVAGRPRWRDLGWRRPSASQTMVNSWSSWSRRSAWRIQGS